MGNVIVPNAPTANSINGSATGTSQASASSFNQVLQQQQAANAQALQQQQAGGTSGTAGGVPVTSSTDPTAAFSAELQQQQAANMQYLELQNTMQQENQTFSTLSNVMKVRADTAKNSISNIH